MSISNPTETRGSGIHCQRSPLRWVNAPLVERGARFQRGPVLLGSSGEDAILVAEQVRRFEADLGRQPRAFRGC